MEHIVTLSDKAPSEGGDLRTTTRDLLENVDCLRPRALVCAVGDWWSRGGGDVEIISHNSLARLLIDEDVGVCTLA